MELCPKCKSDYLKLIEHIITIRRGTHNFASQKKSEYRFFNYYIKSRTYKITGKIDIDWSQTLRKKARGIDDCDLGRVQEVKQDHVVTKKGVVSIDEFLLPKALLAKGDGDCLIFKIGRKDAQLFMRGV